MPIRFLTVLPAIFAFWVSSAQIRKGDAFRNRIDSLNRIAFDQPVEVLRASDSLLPLAKKHKRVIDVGLLLQVKGIAETTLSNNTKALSYHMDSYRIFDSIGNNEGKVYALLNIGAVHLNLEDYQKAETYFRQSLAITPKSDMNSLKTIYANLGVVCDLRDEPKEAIGWFVKALPYLEKLKDYNGLAVTNFNIAEEYNAMQDFTKAEVHYHKALTFQKKSNTKSALAMISLSLGSLYTKLGKTDQAKIYLEIGGKAAKETDSPYYLEQYFECMGEWSAKTGDYRSSVQWLQKLLGMRDSIGSTERAEIHSEMETRFQTDLKSKEIELLKTQKKLASAQLKANRIYGLVLSLVALLCIAIIFVLYRNYQLRQKTIGLLSAAKSDLEEQNLKLENDNIRVQFETLRNQVSPHFLFNSLNALASMIRSNPEKAVEFTSVFSKLFRNVLELKDRPLVSVNEELQHVQSYIYLQKMRFGDNLKVEINVSSQAAKQYLPPFALQLVIENAVKHNIITADKPLAISVTDEQNALVVVNTLQQRQHVEDSTGTGIRNILSRYEYLSGSTPTFGISNDTYRVQLPLLSEE